MSLVPIDPEQPRQDVLSVQADVDLDLWASSMGHAGHIAKALTGTEFVPKSLRKADPGATTAAVAAAVLTGKEVGLSPMAALRSIDVIEGTPAIRAVALRALVLRAGHDIWVEESTATRAIVCGQRSGSSREQRSVWTMDRAKAAGLAGKPNWRSHPSAMLIARATAEVARLIAPDVLLGLPYTVEEISDGDQVDDVQGDEPAKPATPRRTAQRRTRKAASPPPVTVNVAPVAEPVEDEPPLDDEPDEKPAKAAEQEPETPADDAGPTAEAMANTGQLKAIDRALAKVKLTTKHRQLQAVRQIIGRAIAAPEELYAAEALAVLDELARLADRMREQQEAAERQQQLGDDDSDADDRWDEAVATLDDDQATS